MRNVVLTAPGYATAPREALRRALERFPATVEEIASPNRAARLRELAAAGEAEWIVIVDDDVVLAADSFGAFRRALEPQTAIVAGRALVGSVQRVGAMFGPSRSGPNPFDLVPLTAPQTDRFFTDLVRGPIDVPQRGAYAVAADFVRSLAGVPLDPLLLHLDLAVHARAAARSVLCEPSLLFAANDDSLELCRALARLRRYAGSGTWKPQELHRDPPRLRSAFITREVRVMGNIRGYQRRPYPPLDVLVVAPDEMARARAQRSAGALVVGGTLTACAPGDGDSLRAALERTSDRHLLVVDAASLPSRAAVEVLIERVERSGRVAVALENAAPPFGAALFHCGRVIGGRRLAGATIAEIVAEAVARFPERRLFGATPAGEIVPPMLPPLTGLRGLDVVFVAASKPAVTQQTVQALLAEPIDGAISLVYPAGAKTTERLLAVHSGVRLVPDEADVQLAIGLNRALGACTSDLVAIVRDDVQLPRGIFERLKDVFRRIPRLGVAVPRLGGAGRPESVPDLGYRNYAEMQSLYDRRAEAHARESMLLDVATSPVLIVSREVLDVVGGFDEAFGFSRVGVEDFTRRVRAANFLIARCDDAYAHVFPVLEAASFVGNLDDAPFLRESYEKRWSARSGFDPRTDRVPLRADAPPAALGREHRGVRILMPLRDESEWERAQPLLVGLAAAFRVDDPLEIAVGLDGSYGLQTALSALREILIATGIPMEQTLNVSVDFVPDIDAWRDAGENNVRVRGLERDALAELPAVDNVDAVRELFALPVE